MAVIILPSFITAVKDSSIGLCGRVPARRDTMLDPRVAYLMVSLMQSVVNNGTAAGFAAVAWRRRPRARQAHRMTAGSQDLRKLLAITWAGYDDDRDIRLSGAQTALPVWTEFMKRAVALARLSRCSRIFTAFGNRHGRDTGAGLHQPEKG
jgi:penicillin-binding protein 1B